MTRVACPPKQQRNWILFTLVCTFCWAVRAEADLTSDVQIHSALELKLFAAEPHVVDPIGIAFDELGRCFVLEMRDYPLGLGPDHKPGGTIRLIVDTDGDGRVDQSTLFAEDLSFPTSIVAYDGGLFVSAPPEILFLKDTDGDGRADIRRVVFKGFKRGVTDSNLSGLRWGLDNRIHGVNGGNGGTVFPADRPGDKVELREADFSFDPVTLELKATFQTGGGFGLVFDDWGRRFTPYNISHILHQAIPLRYYSHLSHLSPFDSTVSISDHGDMARIYPIATASTRVNHPEQAGHFSSAGGMGFLGIQGYPGNLPGSVFVGDAVSHIMHRDLIVAEGPLFRASRAPEESSQEFFASRDTACRPVGIEMGPDGALYLLDMQRDVIEHPDYIPQKVQEKISLRAGEDRGRIYRMAPKGGHLARVKMPPPSAQDWIALLGHTNQWWRSTAQRMIVSGQQKVSVPTLRQLASHSSNPLARLHALWTLQGLNALTSEDLKSALADSHEGVLENVLQIAELRKKDSQRFVGEVLSLTRHSSARVRFQAILTLGFLTPPESIERQQALEDAWMRDFSWRWSRVAVLIGLSQGSENLLLKFSGKEPSSLTSSNGLAALSELAQVVASRWNPSRPSQLSEVLAQASDPAYPSVARRTLLNALQDVHPPDPVAVIDPKIRSAMGHMAAVASGVDRLAIWRLSNRLGLPREAIQNETLKQATSRVVDRTEPLPQRLEQLGWLELADAETIRPLLLNLFSANEATEVQVGAWKLLKRETQPQVARGLLGRWRGISPSIRTEVIQGLVSRRSWHSELLDAVEQHLVEVGELNLDLEQRRQLLRFASKENRLRAGKFFSDEEYGNRKTVVTDWLEKLPSAGMASKGRGVFVKLCVPCHQVGTLGNAVGPNLTGQSHRSVEDLVSNILDPNMALNPSFATLVIERNDGEIVTGILDSEASEAIVLRQAQGIKTKVLRRDIQKIEYTGKSLMPEGLESTMTSQELRDLVAFLQE